VNGQEGMTWGTSCV